MRRYILLILISILSLIFLFGCVKSTSATVEDARITSKPPYYVGDTLRISIRATGIDKMRIVDGEDVVYEGDFKSYVELKLGFGEHFLKFEGYDSNWNRLCSYDIGTVFVHDPTPPIVKFKISPENPSDKYPVTIELEATDEESGIARVYMENLNTGEIYHDQSFTGYFKPGKYSFLGYAENNDGKGTTKILDFHVKPSDDSEPPNVEVDSPNHVLPGESFTLSILVIDDKGVSSIDVFIDDTLVKHHEVPDHRPSVQVSFTFKAPSHEGKMEVRISAEDLAGNVTDEKLTIQVSENSPPDVELKVSNRTPKPGDRISISVDAKDEDGIDRIELFLDEELLAEVRSDHLDFTLGVDFEGVKRLTAVAYDEFGAYSKTSVTLRVNAPDENPPFVKISVPDKIPVSKSQELRAIVYDESGISDVEFYIYKNGYLLDVLKAFGEGGMIYRASYTFDVEGNYRISVKAKDTFGNVAEAFKDVEVTSMENIEAPEILFSIYPKILEMEEILNVTVIAEDEDGLSRADFYVDDLLIDSKEFATSNRLDFKWITRFYGEHIARVVVYDLKGYSAQASDTFTVITEVPTITFVSPENDEELPFSENTELDLMVKVLDSSSPSSAYFDVIGLDSTTLKASVKSEGPNYVFQSSWIPSHPGDYRIRFRYTNIMNISCEEEIEIHVKDTGVIFKLPSSNVHTAGHDMEVWITASKDVESGRLVLVTPDSAEHEIDLKMEERADGIKDFTGVIPGSMFMTLTETYSYILKFTAVSGELEQTHSFYFMVVDDEPPSLTVMIDGMEISDGTRVNLDINQKHVMNITASDNYSLDSVKVYKRGALVSFSPSGNLSLEMSLDIFENPYEVVAVDSKANTTRMEFEVYASEANPPVSTPSNVDLIPVEGFILNVNAESKVNYSDFELGDDTGLDRVFYTLTGPGGYEFEGTLWTGNGVKYTRISVDRNGSFYIKAGGIPGFYTLSLKAVDVFGNTVTLGSVMIEVRDVVNPLVRVEIDENEVEKYVNGLPVISGNGIKIRVYALDNLESIKKIGLIVKDESGKIVRTPDSPDYPGNFYDFLVSTDPILSDGIVEITGFATSSSGICSSSTVYAVLDNRKNPYVHLVLPDTVRYNDIRVYSGILDMEAVVSGISVPNDINEIVLLVDDSTLQVLKTQFTSGTVPLSIDTTGYAGTSPHTISVRVFDDAGNESEVIEGENRVTVIFDNYPPYPIYKIILGKNVILTSDPMVTVYFSEDTSVGGVMFHIWSDSNDSVISTDRGNATVVSEKSVTMDLTDFFSSEGTANYTMYSYDIVGNTGVSTGVIYYDTSPPVGTITGVENLEEGIATSDVVLNVEMEDRITWVSTITLWATSSEGEVQEEKAIGLPLMTRNASIEWTPFDSSEGTAKVFLDFEDVMNHDYVTSTSIVYDTLPPRYDVSVEDAMTNVEYPNHMFVDGDTATLTWSATDMNFRKMEFRAWIGDNLIWDFHTTSASGTSTLALSRDATHLLEITGYDLARSSRKDTILVSDMTTPVISSATLINLTTFESSSIQNNSTVVISEGELKYLYKLTISFDELWPDFSRIRLVSEERNTDITSESTGEDFVSFTLKFSTDDTLTFYAIDVVSHEASWIFFVDAR